jgi:hypothetical protein
MVDEYSKKVIDTAEYSKPDTTGQSTWVTRGINAAAQSGARHAGEARGSIGSELDERLHNPLFPPIYPIETPPFRPRANTLSSHSQSPEEAIQEQFKLNESLKRRATDLIAIGRYNKHTENYFEHRTKNARRMLTTSAVKSILRYITFSDFVGGAIATTKVRSTKAHIDKLNEQLSKDYTAENNPNYVKLIEAIDKTTLEADIRRREADIRGRDAHQESAIPSNIKNRMLQHLIYTYKVILSYSTADAALGFAPLHAFGHLAAAAQGEVSIQIKERLWTPLAVTSMCLHFTAFLDELFDTRNKPFMSIVNEIFNSSQISTMTGSKRKYTAAGLVRDPFGWLAIQSKLLLF